MGDTCLTQHCSGGRGRGVAGVHFIDVLIGETRSVPNVLATIVAIISLQEQTPFPTFVSHLPRKGRKS